MLRMTPLASAIVALLIGIEAYAANNVKVNYETIMIAPLESQSIYVNINNSNNWHLTIIDDHGNYISDKI